MATEAMLAMAKRFERAREWLDVKNPTEMARLIWPGETTKRTRYETLLRTLRLGSKYPRWDSLEPVVAYFARNHVRLTWLLFGEGPPHELGERRLEQSEATEESHERPVVRKKSPR